MMKENEEEQEQEERRKKRGEGGEGTYPNRDPQREHERKDDNVRHNVVSRERDDAKVASTQAKQLKRPPLKRRHQDAREAKREILCMSNNRQHTYVHTLEKNRSTKKTREREREREKGRRESSYPSSLCSTFGLFHHDLPCTRSTPSQHSVPLRSRPRPHQLPPPPCPPLILCRTPPPSTC